LHLFHHLIQLLMLLVNNLSKICCCLLLQCQLCFTLATIATTGSTRCIFDPYILKEIVLLGFADKNFRNSILCRLWFTTILGVSAILLSIST
jgi:hypothetical protein